MPCPVPHVGTWWKVKIDMVLDLIVLTIYLKRQTSK